MEDLYNYKYPFALSKSFRNYKNKTDCFLKTEILKSLWGERPKKIFYFFQFLQEIIKEDFIERRIQIVLRNGKIRECDFAELKVNNLNGRIDYLIFYENLFD